MLWHKMQFTFTKKTDRSVPRVINSCHEVSVPDICLVLHLQEYDAQYFLAEAAPRLEPLRCFTQTSFDANPAFESRTETDLFCK